MFAHGRRWFPRYYCPTRSTDPDTYPCTDRAYFCPAGAASPTAVRSGYYSVQTADGSGTCPDGQLCSERECDAGHYCVSGVKYACPAGRWGNGTRLTSQQQCSLCPAGRYAQHSTPGISHVTPWFPHPCCVAGVAGWLPAALACRFGAMEAELRPLCQGACGAGSYCPAGSVSATAKACPAGTWAGNGSATQTCAGSCAPGYVNRYHTQRPHAPRAVDTRCATGTTARQAPRPPCSSRVVVKPSTAVVETRRPSPCRKVTTRHSLQEQATVPLCAQDRLSANLATTVCPV